MTSCVNLSSSHSLFSDFISRLFCCLMKLAYRDNFSFSDTQIKYKPNAVAAATSKTQDKNKRNKPQATASASSTSFVNKNGMSDESHWGKHIKVKTKV